MTDSPSNLIPPEPQECPIPNSPLDTSLRVVELRRLIVAWRESASTAAEREARIYRQAERDVAVVISGHAETRAVWAAARHDLLRALTEALEARGRETS